MPEKAKASGPCEDEAPCKLLKHSDPEIEEGEKPASPSKAVDISDACFAAEVQALLVGADLSCITFGELRGRLEARMGLTVGALASRKTLRRRISFLVHQEVLKKSQRSEECEKIVKEILKLDCPMSVRQMLIDSLHHCLSVPDATGLHPHQVRLLGIARDALSEGMVKLEDMHHKCEEVLQTVEVELHTKETQAAAAMSEAVKAKEVAVKAEATAKETESEMAELRKDLETFSQKAKEVFQETQELSQKQKAIVEVQKRLDCMAQGLWGSDEEWWECFAALQQHLLDTGAESSLLTAATVSLKKQPVERSEFDVIAVEAVCRFLAEQLLAASRQLSLRPQLEMEAEAATLSRQSLLNATQQRAMEHAQAFKEASDAQEQCSTIAANAAAALPDSQARADEQRQQQADFKSRLQLLGEAIHQVSSWISGSSIPPVGAGAQAEDGKFQPALEANKVKIAGCQKDEAKFLDVNSPLRVPTPMKGRLST